MKLWRNGVKIAAGALIGLGLSVCPDIFFMAALVVILLVRACISNGRNEVVSGITACLVLTICFFLPVKELDTEVGPMAYYDITLPELCDRLHADWGIVCRLPGSSSETCRLTFITDQPMSRREVLEELSTVTRRRLKIGYCGTGATILFGAHPSFTYLEAHGGSDRKADSLEVKVGP